MRQHDRKHVGTKLQSMTTFTLELKVEGVGSITEAMEKTFAVEVREVDDDDDTDPGTDIKNATAEFDFISVHDEFFACLGATIIWCAYLLATGKPVKYKFEYSTKFVELPRVLCVQLSRFSFDYSRGVPYKHNHRVEFPLDLDMAAYTEGPGNTRFVMAL
jgi:hypothetical protein